MDLSNNIEVSAFEKLSMNLKLRKHQTVLTDYVRHCFLRNKRVDLIFLCDENKKIGTHKLLFSLVSEFMKVILQNSNEAAYISLKGYKDSTLKVLLKILLTGSANVELEDFDNLKSLVSILGITGLDQLIQSCMDNAYDNNEYQGNDYAIDDRMCPPSISDPLASTTSNNGILHVPHNQDSNGYQEECLPFRSSLKIEDTNIQDDEDYLSDDEDTTQAANETKMMDEDNTSDNYSESILPYIFSVATVSSQPLPESTCISSWQSSNMNDNLDNELSHISVDTLNFLSGEDIEENLREEEEGDNFTHNLGSSGSFHVEDPLAHSNSEVFTNSENSIEADSNNDHMTNLHASERNASHLKMKVSSLDEIDALEFNTGNTVNHVNDFCVINSDSSVIMQTVSAVDSEDNHSFNNPSKTDNVQENVLDRHAGNNEVENELPTANQPVEPVNKEGATVEKTGYSLRSSGTKVFEENRLRVAEKRIKLTEEQCLILKNSFKSNMYITPEDRCKLARRLDLPEKCVRIWFNNYRRSLKIGLKKKLKLKRRKNVWNTSYKKTYLTTRGQHQQENQAGESKITVKEFLRKKKSIDKGDCTIVLQPLKNVQKEKIKELVDNSNNVMKDDESECEEGANDQLVEKLQLYERDILESTEDLDSLSPGTSHSPNKETGSALDNCHKKQRISASSEQADILEKSFRDEKYPTLAARKILAKRLGLRENVVKNWFSNRRSKLKRNAYMKGKKMKKKLTKVTTGMKYGKIILPGSMKCRSAHQAVSAELKEILAETAAEWFGDRARSPKKSGSGILDLSEFIKDEVEEDTEDQLCVETSVNIVKDSSAYKDVLRKDTNVETQQASDVHQSFERVKEEIGNDTEHSESDIVIEETIKKKSNVRRRLLGKDATIKMPRDSCNPYLTEPINEETAINESSTSAEVNDIEKSIVSGSPSRRKKNTKPKEEPINEEKEINESSTSAEVNDVEKSIVSSSPTRRKKTTKPKEDIEPPLQSNLQSYEVKQEIVYDEMSNGFTNPIQTRSLRKSSTKESILKKDTKMESVEDLESPLQSHIVKEEILHEEMTNGFTSSIQTRALRKSTANETISKKNTNIVKDFEAPLQSYTIKKEIGHEEMSNGLTSAIKTRTQRKSTASESIWKKDTKNDVKGKKNASEIIPMTKRGEKFSDQQRQILEDFFKKEPYPSLEAKTKLGIQIGRSAVSVSIWFDNRRRGMNNGRSKAHKMQNKAVSRKHFNYLSLRQKKILEKSFQKNSRPSAEEEEKLSHTLGISEVIVHNWFKGKRCQEKKGVKSRAMKPHHASKKLKTILKAEDIKKEKR